MVRLIVEDGAEKRGFRVKDGRLSVGAGERARLRLKSAGVVEDHAELEIRGEIAIVRPHGKVLVDGRPVATETTVEVGQWIQMGRARLALEPDEGAAPKPIVRSRAATVGARRRNAGRKTGMPAWKAGAMAVGLAGVILALLYMVYAKVSDQAQADPGTLIRVAREAMQAGNFPRAEETLARVPPASQLAGPLRSERAALEEEMARYRVGSEAGTANIEGYKYFEVKLERYRNDHLGEDLRREKIRFFLKRCQEFRRKWPHHPELSWVAAEEERLTQIVKLEDPVTWNELDWEVKNLTAGQPPAPRRYREAFALINQFLEDCEGVHCGPAQHLLDEMRLERKKYFDAVSELANDAYLGENIPRAVGLLIELVVNIGDNTLAGRAAAYMLKIPGLDSYLRALRNTDPDRFRLLVREQSVSKFAREAGLL